MKRFLVSILLAAPIAFSQTAACPGFPNCLYPAGQTYGFERATIRIAYKDIVNRDRTVEVTARIPIGRQGPLPVVIWVHGGGDGRNGQGASVGALSDWSETTAENGYLSLGPAFHAREEEDQLALCKYLGLAEGDECDTLSTPTWDRPYDIKAILDELVRQNRAGPLRGRIDLDRIAVAGHSAGSSGTLSVAGATREIGGKRYGPAFFADPRPKAFVALSPSAPGLSYMFDRRFNDESTSWDGIERPVLWITGAGDGHEQFPHGRRIGFGYLPPGDKFRLWVNDVSFGHSAFGDDFETCGDGGVPARKCEPFRAVLASTVRAFLDAYLERRPQAIAYLQNGYVALAAKDVLEWTKR